MESNGFPQVVDTEIWRKGTASINILEYICYNKFSYIVVHKIRDARYHIIDTNRGCCYPIL